MYKEDKRRNKEGIPVKCHCGYFWFYSGKKLYPQCPGCFSRISLKKHRLDGREADYISERNNIIELPPVFAKLEEIEQRAQRKARLILRGREG